MTGTQTARIDVSACDREAIHIPGSIQPQGLLMTLDPANWTILQVSLNTKQMLGLALEKVLGNTLQEVLGADSAQSLLPLIANLQGGEGSVYLRTLQSPLSGRVFTAVAHKQESAVILELELADSLEALSFGSLYPLVLNLAERLRRASTPETISDIAANEIRRITDFDRVLIYKFDANWNGQVLAESRTADLPSYLHLWFPASDIPPQARKLYELNRMRIIADAGYQPVPIYPPDNPLTKKPLDLSFATLRSVSPVHLEYLKNMGVGSSMSISLIGPDQRLWGLIACHHREPRRTPLEVRTACDLISRLLGGQLEMSEQQAVYQQQLALRSLTTQLLAFMAQETDFIDGLTHHPQELLAFGHAQGAAVVYGGSCTRLGSCPAEEDIWQIVNRLADQGWNDVFETDRSAEIFPNGAALAHSASGVLAISISKFFRSYVLWFRPEFVKTVNWAGDPRKSEDPATLPDRLHPRKSFEIWRETVSGTSQKWTPVEVEAAGALRNAIIGIVLRKAEELADLSAELQRSNKELEAFSYSVSHDLRAPFRHIVGYAELLSASTTANLSAGDRRFIEIIIDSAHYAGTLVDNLLSFSQVGRATLKPRRLSMAALLTDVRRDLVGEAHGRKVVWKIGPLPDVLGDPLMLKLVLQNLIENALKYSRTREETVIEVAWRAEESEDIFHVRDNGVGFEQVYAGKLFGMFQRLHKVEEYEGTGIGLANVRAMIARHGGRTWAEGELNKGATFYFSLPKKRILEEVHA